MVHLWTWQHSVTALVLCLFISVLIAFHTRLMLYHAVDLAFIFFIFGYMYWVHNKNVYWIPSRNNGVNPQMKWSLNTSFFWYDNNKDLRSIFLWHASHVSSLPRASDLQEPVEEHGTGSNQVRGKTVETIECLTKDGSRYWGLSAHVLKAIYG